MKKTLKISLSVLLAVFLLAVVLFGFQYWRIKTGRILKVNVGGEEMWITKETFQKSMPRLDNVVAPDQNTPEEVYTKFREAIINDDIEGALQYVSDRKRQEYREILPKYLDVYKKLPEFKELIKLEGDVETIQRSYQYKNGESVYDLEFEKSTDGNWFIYII